MPSETLQINASLSIPMSEIDFRFATSGGPGGQHVNRSNTQAELLFDVANSPSLDDDQRRKIYRQLGNRITKEGVLQVVSQSTRSQKQNRDDAIHRFANLLREALKTRRRRRRTRPTRASKERRLKEKKRRSDIKQKRKKPEL